MTWVDERQLPVEPIGDDATFEFERQLGIGCFDPPVFTGDDEWLATLRRVCSAVTPEAHVVFETRDPASSAWREWNEKRSRRTIDLPGVGAVESWVELTAVNGSLVSFRWTYVSSLTVRCSRRTRPCGSAPATRSHSP